VTTKSRIVSRWTPTPTQYSGKERHQIRTQQQGDIYVLDVTGGILDKIEFNHGRYAWETAVSLSSDYPRAVNLAVDEQDRIVLGIAGVEIHPLNEPSNPDHRIVLLQDLGIGVRLLGSKSGVSIRFFIRTAWRAGGCNGG
jgi:hypothetical protein